MIAHPRVLQVIAALSLALFYPPAGHTQLVDPGDCTGPAADALCVPTPSCTAFGNAPAIYDPANVAVTPTCTGGQLLGPVPDADGTPRYACLYAPAQASAANPLPLVVFLHPSLFNSDSVNVTGLPTMTASADLTGDPARPGFILLAPEGRRTCHYYPTADQRAEGWDNWYRNLDPMNPAQNVDVTTIDHFVDEQVASGIVDVERIYVTGWSNGAAMGFLYGLHRPSVAAVAVYSAPDPFRTFNDPCPQVPVAGTPASNAEIQVPNRGVPTFHVHNDCDIASICPNGERLEASLRALPGSADHLLINSALLPATACDSFCGTNPNGDFNPCTSVGGYTVGLTNHVRWPVPYTSAMLAFLRGHPLAAPDGPDSVLVTRARVRRQSAGGGSGSVDVKGAFMTAPPTDTFDAGVAITVRVEDGLAVDYSRTFAAGNCATQSSGRVICRSTDRLTRARFVPEPGVADRYRFRVKARGVAIDPPFAPPVSVTLIYGSGPNTRVGVVTFCRPAGYGLHCP